MYGCQGCDGVVRRKRLSEWGREGGIQQGAQHLEDEETLDGDTEEESRLELIIVMISCLVLITILSDSCCLWSDRCGGGGHGGHLHH